MTNKKADPETNADVTPRTNEEAKASTNTIREGEMAVKLKYDIQGGLGNHKSGTVLRNLSWSAFNTLSKSGGHEVLEVGTSAGNEAVDASSPAA